MNATSHRDEDFIETYVLGRLSQDQSASFEEHLLICPVCQAATAEAEVYVEAMQGALSEARSGKAGAIKGQS